MNEINKEFVDDAPGTVIRGASSSRVIFIIYFMYVLVSVQRYIGIILAWLKDLRVAVRDVT